MKLVYASNDLQWISHILSPLPMDSLYINPVSVTLCILVPSFIMGKPCAILLLPMFHEALFLPCFFICFLRISPETLIPFLA